MPKTKPETAALEAPRSLTDAEWKKWFQNGHAPMWIAALLSLDICPRPTIETALKKRHPAQYEVFIKRCRVLKRNYGHHILRRIDHELASKHQYGEVVDLLELCAFAHEKNLEGAVPMIRALRPELLKAAQAAPMASGRTAVGAVVVGEKTSMEEVNLPASTETVAATNPKKSKGDEYLLVTIGALALLIEKIVTGHEKLETQYLHGGRLNQTEVGIELEALIGDRASAKNHGESAIRSRLRAGIESVGGKKTRRQADK